jgi:hypothetical protein
MLNALRPRLAVIGTCQGLTKPTRFMHTFSDNVLNEIQGQLPTSDTLAFSHVSCQQ